MAIWTRIMTESNKYKDKWKYHDKLKLTSIPLGDGKSRYKVESLGRGLQSFIITKDELAFIRLIFMQYGSADYCIKIWGKGKERGIRIFWDGIITAERKFLRRKNTGASKVFNISVFERESFAKNPEQYIGRYFKTKRPGQWNNF